MARLHHSGNVADSLVFDVVAACQRLQQFIGSCRQPAILEEGDEPLMLAADNYSLDVRSGRLWLEAWTEQRTLARRITSIKDGKPGFVICSVHRFGNVPGRLTVFDADRPASGSLTASAGRRSFGEKLRLMLARNLPGSELLSLTSARDLRRSLSSLYPRAHLRVGHQHMAALACAVPEEESGLLTSALLWYDQLRQRISAGDSLRLILFLPEGCGALTAQRLRWLTGQPLKPCVYLFNEHGSAGEVVLSDLGNVETSVLPPGETRRPMLKAQGAELQLEGAVRRSLAVLDPTLQPHLLHGQVLTFLSGERSILDLLTVERSGRLVILELKAGEDLLLPLQALDYWIRIRWHAARSELNPLFPGVSLSGETPRLLLVAPATQFHSTNATILRYFSPEIPVERIGLNFDAATHLTVVMRLSGADPPISHQND